MRSDLAPFFSPEGVAIIGASSNPNKLSYGLFKNLTSYGFTGHIYPVNPKANTILGLQCYPSVADVPDPVDLAVIALPAPLVKDVVQAIGQRGIKAAIIISGGFKEVGSEGVDLENQILDIAHNFGMRIIGPNCVGTVDLHTGLNTTFIDGMPDKGGIGFLSQSGAVLGGVVSLFIDKHVGFSHLASLGNEADVTETDVIEFLASDPNVKVISAYVEEIREGQCFIKLAREISRTKPIVLLKAGRTEAGARAVSSHTGSIAGSMSAYEAAFKQSGVITANSLNELFEIALALDFQPAPKGKRTVLLTNSGGPAALASDALAINGLTLQDLAPETKAALRQHLNPAAGVSNPVDMLGGAAPEDYGRALRTLLADAHVDSVIVILVPTSLIDPVDIANQIIAAAQETDKPVLTCFIADKAVIDAREVLHTNRIPMYTAPESAARAMSAMYFYDQWLQQNSDSISFDLEIDRDSAAILMEEARGQTALGEADTRPLLETYGIHIIQGLVAHSADEAAMIASGIGKPVALKIVSPDILHKSDVGGIILNLETPKSVSAAYEEMMITIQSKLPQANLEGVLVEEMAPPGSEVIIGMRRDPSFGPLVMFGMGGIYVELFKDVAFRVAPFDRAQAEQMIAETKAGTLLAGYRGQEKADIDAIVDAILKLSQLALDFPQIEEIEINPLSVGPEGQGAVALDGRVILSGKE
jgi:acetate---CoA ligase (ADP-forming)